MMSGFQGCSCCHWGLSIASSSQDVVFIVRQVPDNRYQREGDDLITRVRIKLPDALSESKIDVPHIDGRILRVPLKEASSWPSYP